MVEQGLDEALKSKGITDEYVIGLIKEAVELAREGNKPGILIEAADRFHEMLHAKQNKKLQAFEIGITREIGDAVQSVRKELEETTYSEETDDDSI